MRPRANATGAHETQLLLVASAAGGTARSGLFSRLIASAAGRAASGRLLGGLVAGSTGGAASRRSGGMGGLTPAKQIT